MEREHLEVLGRQLTDAQEAHTKHVSESNAQLEAKEKNIQADADTKAEADSGQLAEEHGQEQKRWGGRF